MAERIELPPMLQGDEKAQLHQLWSYLYQMSDALNNNLEAIGGNELTDSERKTMNTILTAGEQAKDQNDMETLKSLIIKTADFVQTTVQEWRMNLLGESVASGQFGRYVRHTGLDVEVTPEGITQNYSFEEVVQGLKEYAVNAKNYIKTGLLRTVSSIPVYGVAIGKDVVTFSEDGTETYNDGNKVAELTAEELSFWQNGVKIAGYTGSKISFYYGGSEVFYIQQGKIYATNDLELASGKKVIVGNWEFSNEGMVFEDPNYTGGFEIAEYSNRNEETSGVFYRRRETQGGSRYGELMFKIESYYDNNKYENFFVVGTKILNGLKTKFIGPMTGDGFSGYIGMDIYPFDGAYIRGLYNVDRILPQDYWSESTIGDEYGSFKHAYISKLHNVDKISVDPNGTNRQLGGVGANETFSEAYIESLRNVKYILADSNDAGLAIGSEQYPFKMIYADKLQGAIVCVSLQNVDLNTLNKSGRYLVREDNITNKPSGIAAYSYVEIDHIEAGAVYTCQKLYTQDAIYIRRKAYGTWQSWYKFQGTAV